MFEIENKAVEYCEQYGISEDDPRRADVINAFCVGAQIERDRCVKIASDFNTFPHAREYIGKRIAAAIEAAHGIKE